MAGIDSRIPNLSTSWEGYLKGRVEEFIKQQISELRDGKVGHIAYENGRILGYDTEGGTLITSISLSGTVYAVNLATTTPSSFYVLRDATTAYINITPTTMSGTIGSQLTPFTEDYEWQIQIDNGTGTYTTRMSGVCASGGTINANVRSYLAVGENRIKVIVMGLDSQQSKTLTFSASVTSLSLTSSFDWQNPWIEGQSFSINRLNFSGNLQKTLHVKVDNDDTQEYTISFSAGTNYTTSFYSFDMTGKEPTDLTTGIHTVEVWMSGDNVETQHFTYNIMFVAAADVSTAELVCINEIVPAVMNWEQQTVFKFATYGSTEVSVTITVDDGSTEHIIVAGQVLSVLAGSQNEYVMNLEVDSESTNMTMNINVATGESGQTTTVPVDNSLSYAAVDGASFYMNAASRSNDSADRETIINEIANAEVAEYEGTWTGFSWAKDGWYMDADSIRCLSIPAGSYFALPDLSLVDAATRNMTWEFKFRCANIADYNTPVLSLMSTQQYDAETTNGIILFPTKIEVLSSTKRDHVVQSVNLYENSILHLVIVFQRGYNGTAYNLCHIYVNGIRQAVFEYDGGGTFGTGTLRIGQQSSDFYLYMMRIYYKVLEDFDVLTNFLNTLTNTVDISRTGVREDNNILDTGSIDYELAKRAGYNTMVVEMAQGAYLPDLDHSNGGLSTLWLEYADHPEWNVMIENAPIDGQGTTSKKYYRWNLRWKLKGDVYEQDGVTIKQHAAKFTYADGTTETKKGYIDGQGNHPKVKKIVAKKNVASSMQGHKMGATAMYDDLFAALGYKAGMPSGARVAVFQHPFLGFEKKDGAYVFIGLYTCGPDKGDDATFGYDADTYPSFLSIEGPNHNPLGTRFLHPWNADVAYSSSDETMTFGGEEGWDVDSCPYETDVAADNTNIMNLLTAEWKPAYDIAYYCSIHIRSLAEVGMTLSQLNALSENEMSAWRAQTNILTTRKNEVLQLYDSSYNLIYYRNATGKYEVLSGHNIVTYLSGYLSTQNPTTEQIIAARKAKFMAEVGNYWDINHCCFHEAYCELIGAKDNHAKNTYPFKLATLASGGRWSWREDDLDSILPTDNNGQSTAHYGIEVGDLTNEGVDIFQGSSSAFWTLIIECYQDRIGTILGRMLNALRDMAIDKGIAGSNLHEAVFNMFDFYFWQHSAKYFPIMAYAGDSRFSYIDVWLRDINANNHGRTYNNVFPLNQALGTQLEAEKQWVERRIVNLCSKYSLGGFTGSGNDGYRSLEFTPAQPFTFTITPAIEMYPSGNLGGGTDVKGVRTKEGQTCQITASSTGDTGFYLKALDWLSDMGDLCGLRLTSRAGGTISFAVTSKRLRRLKIGDINPSNVLFNSPTLEVSGESFEVIDARNVVSLTGVVSLINCPRLQKAYFSGSGATGLVIPEGARVDHVEFPSVLTALILNQLPLLTENDMVIPAAAIPTIRNFYFRNCPNIDGFQMLRDILANPNNDLHFVTMIWNGVFEGTGEDLTLLYQLSEMYTVEGGVERGYGFVTYQNGQISSESTGRANLQGTFHLNGYYYGDELERVQAVFPNLTITADESPYIRFEDAEVERICSINWGVFLETVVTTTVTDESDEVTVTTVVRQVSMLNTTRKSVIDISTTTTTRAKEEGETAGTTSSTTKTKLGMTYAQAGAVSSLGTVFQNNTQIRTFNELALFLGLSNLANGCFSRSSIEEVTLPESIRTITGGTQFLYCNQLKKITALDGLTSITAKQWVWGAAPSGLLIILPSTINNLYSDTLSTYGNNNSTIVVCRAITPPTKGTTNYHANVKYIYVPDDSVEAYKAASGWSQYASKIKPLSEYTG